MSGEDAIWLDLVRASELRLLALRSFLTEVVDRAGMVLRGMRGTGLEVTTALDMVAQLDVSERLELFDELVRLCLSQKYGSHVRGLIAALPRDWVLDHIEGASGPLLQGGDPIDYRMMLELYLVLDAGLTMKLAMRAAAQQDVDTVEAGEDYIALLAVSTRYPRLKLK